MKRAKPKPTASFPSAVLMLSLTLNPSLLSTEREREFIYSQKLLVVVIVVNLLISFLADKASAE